MAEQLPLVDEVLAEGVAAFVQARPSAAPFVNSGRYGDIFEGWRAQLDLLNRRLTAEVRAARLMCDGEDLADLVSSEFRVEVSRGQQKAIGEAILLRTQTVPSPTPTFSVGVIKQGTKFRKDPDPTANPPVEAAEYASTRSVLVTNDATLPGSISINYLPGSITITSTDLGGGQFRHRQYVTVPIQCTVAGPAGNDPKIQNVVDHIVLADTLFTADFTGDGTDSGVISARAAGGSSGQADDDLRRIAKAARTGGFAPVEAALVAGALSNAGVKRVAVLNDTALARSIIYIADQSWGASTQLTQTVTSILRSAWAGFGIRFVVRPFVNRVVGVKATAILAKPDDIANTEAIDQSVRTALAAYFDERPDPYIFRRNSIGGVIASASRKILVCSPSPAPTVIDMQLGTDIDEPAQPTAADGSLTHYLMASNGVRITYKVPS